VAPFPAPPSQTVHEVLPHTAFHQAVDQPHSATPPALTTDPATREAPRPTGSWLLQPHTWLEALRYDGLCCPRRSSLPMASSDFRSALRHFAGPPLIGFAATGHRELAARSHHAGAKTDLSCSTMGCVIVPFPIGRRVPGCCASKVLAPSMAFARLSRARLPLASRSRGVVYDPAGFLVVQTDHLLAAHGDVVMALRRSGLPFRRPPATGLLGHYPGRTPTGKSIAASQDTPQTTHRGRIELRELSLRLQAAFGGRAVP
jgi:hypothetical protein